MIDLGLYVRTKEEVIVGYIRIETRIDEKDMQISITTKMAK